MGNTLYTINSILNRNINSLDDKNNTLYHMINTLNDMNNAVYKTNTIPCNMTIPLYNI